MRQLMEERVLKPEGSQLAQTAYIYNGFEDIELKYAGRIWKVPRGTVTEVKPFTWREVDQMKSDGATIVMELHSVEGEVVARELVEKHGWNEAGIQVFLKRATQQDAEGNDIQVGLDDVQVESLKVRCEELGRLYKLAKIDEFRKGREMARAGRMGYRLHPSENEIRWMKELKVEDDIFNPQNLAADTETKMREIVSAATKPFADMMERFMKGEVAPPETAAAVAPPSSIERSTGPRRRSVNGKLEPLEVYEKRRAEWQAARDAVDKAEAEAADAVEV